jgi:cytoskeletal protein RodZ
VWESIAYVAGGVTLAAFIVAAAVTAFRSALVQKERLIRQAPEHDRAKLVQEALDSLRVNTAGLSPKDRYKLVLRKFDERATRFRITAFVVVIIACLAATIAIVAIIRDTSNGKGADANPRQTPTPNQNSSPVATANVPSSRPSKTEPISTPAPVKSIPTPTASVSIEPPTTAAKASWNLITSWVTATYPPATVIDHIKRVDDPGCTAGCQRVTVALKDSGGTTRYEHFTVTYQFTNGKWQHQVHPQ